MVNVGCSKGKYKTNYIRVKKYSDSLYKVVHVKKSTRVTGAEDESEVYYGQSKGTVNDEKLDTNVARARSKVFDYSMCNSWDFFVTLTLNQKLYNRFDLKKYSKDLSQFIRDYNKKHGVKMKYMLIPEMHEDGAWHMHGFIYGLPESHLITNSYGYLDWEAYKNKFGYISLDKIRSQEGASKYITKYIKKDLSARSRELNAHLYYCSKGLKQPEIIKEGTPNSTFGIPCDWENDFVSILWLKDKNINVLDTIITWDWEK